MQISACRLWRFRNTESKTVHQICLSGLRSCGLGVWVQDFEGCVLGRGGWVQDFEHTGFGFGAQWLGFLFMHAGFGVLGMGLRLKGFWVIWISVCLRSTVKPE